VTDREDRERALRATRAALGDERFASAHPDEAAELDVADRQLALAARNRKAHAAAATKIRDWFRGQLGKRARAAPPLTAEQQSALVARAIVDAPPAGFPRGMLGPGRIAWATQALLDTIAERQNRPLGTRGKRTRGS